MTDKSDCYDSPIDVGFQFSPVIKCSDIVKPNESFSQLSAGSTRRVKTSMLNCGLKQNDAIPLCAKESDGKSLISSNEIVRIASIALRKTGNSFYGGNFGVRDNVPAISNKSAINGNDKKGGCFISEAEFNEFVVFQAKKHSAKFAVLKSVELLTHQKKLLQEQQKKLEDQQKLLSLQHKTLQIYANELGSSENDSIGNLENEVMLELQELSLEVHEVESEAERIAKELFSKRIDDINERCLQVNLYDSSCNSPSIADTSDVVLIGSPSAISSPSPMIVDQAITSKKGYKRKKLHSNPLPLVPGGNQPSGALAAFSKHAVPIIRGACVSSSLAVAPSQIDEFEFDENLLIP